MTQIEQIKAEIERLKNMKGYLPIERRELYDAYQARGYQYACDDILSFREYHRMLLSAFQSRL